MESTTKRMRGLDADFKMHTLQLVMDNKLNNLIDGTL